MHEHLTAPPLVKAALTANRSLFVATKRRLGCRSSQTRGVSDRGHLRDVGDNPGCGTASSS
jgi:hypothetical protein